MIIDDKITHEEVQHDVNREGAKLSALLLRKIDKYEFPTGKEILPSNQRRIIEQAKFTNFPLGKPFEKQIKTIEDQRIKQVEALKALKSDENNENIQSIELIFPKDMKPNEIENEIYEIKKWEKEIKRKDLKYDIKKIHI